MLAEGLSLQRGRNLPIDQLRNARIRRRTIFDKTSLARFPARAYHSI
ncbi:hypothetical protein ABIA24_004987 [Sinorhizobium fredii]